MPDDKLIPANAAHRDRPPLPAVHQGPGPLPTYGEEPYYPTLEPETEGLDLRRYLHSLVRFKWLILLALLIGAGASYYVWTTTVAEYRAQGALWIERDGGRFEPIQDEGVLQDDAWLQLLRSAMVLDSVVLAQRLHIHAPGEYSAAFRSLELDEGFEPGAYELRIDPNGVAFVLASADGAIIESGRLGEAIGETLGFDWRPRAGSFPAGDVIPFQVQTARDASRALSARLDARLDGQGNFLQLSLDGRDPQGVAYTANGVMERFVAASKEIQTARLQERLSILEQQLESATDELFAAETAYQEFRIETITLPADRSGAVVGGLQETNNPVFSNFFDMRVREEETRRTKERLQAVLRSVAETGEVRIEALEMIPETANSSELRRSLDELVDARAQLRALSDRYSPEYPPIQDLLVQIASIEENSIPRVINGIISVLETQERELSSRVAEQSVELEAIPARTIEGGRLERSVGVTEDLYGELRSRVEAARLAAVSSVPEVRILDRAQVPTGPLSDDRLRLVLMIMLGCLGAAMGGAILLDQTDAKFRYAGDVSRHIGLGILGSIPRIEGGVGKQGVLNAAHALEAFRELRIHVGFAYGSAGPITLTVTSPSEGEGKSLISSNLAVAFAEVGQRTLLIDGDTRRGNAHRLFGLHQSPGLIDYLKESAGQEVIQTTPHDNLDFIGSGPRGTSTPELLASARMAHFMGMLKQSYDVIIVDSPPLASGGDPLILGTLTGNVAVVIRTGSTEKQMAQAKLDQLSRLPIRVLGAILNDVDPSDGYNYYYSSYLPGYEAGMGADDDHEGVELISDGSSR